MAENEAPNEKSLISASDYFTLMENTPLTLVVFDKDGKLIFINKGGREEYFIKDTDDISKWSWLATVKEPYRDIVRGKFQNALRGQAVNFEFEHTPEGSKYAWCSGFMSPIKDGTGAMKAIFFYSYDITAMKRAELEAKENKMAMLNLLEDARGFEEELVKSKTNIEAQVWERTQQLKEEESRLMASINSLSLGFIMVDVAGKAIITNKAIERFFTPDLDESIFDATIRSLRGSFDLDANYKKILSEKKQIDAKSIPFGSKYLRIFMEPIFIIDDPALIGVVVLIEDITEQELLDQSKSNFLAIASHEMRTPLSIIRGDAELLLGSVAPSDDNKNIIKYTTGIRQNSMRLLDILNDFIEVIRMDEKPLELKKENVNIADLVNDIIASFGKAASEKNITLVFQASVVPLPAVVADLSKVRDVITNLISNAIHYTEKGGITVAVNPVVRELSPSLVFSEKISEGKHFLKISVTDTGIGIPKENQSMLFQKFSTVSKTFLHTKEYGSGLGLYIAKILSEAMGGFIWLEKSEPGEGSTFAVALPASS